MYAEELEREVATFHGAEAALLFNSGFDANAGFFSCVPQPGDTIFYDDQIHASVHEGMRLSRAGEKVLFAHNSVEDLRTKLTECIQQDTLIIQGRRNVFVAVEALYSMDGDLAPIEAIVELVEELLPGGNGHVVVDEAHSNGVYGFQGRGIVCSLGLESRIFARLHTFGKGLACSGAMMLCSLLTREYLINYARPLIYTTAISFPSLAAIKVVYSLMKQGQTQHLIAKLNELIDHLYSRLETLEIPTKVYNGVRKKALEIPRQKPQSPIFSLVTPEPRSLAKYCQDNGFVVRPIVPPTVPKGTERVRVCLHSGNTILDIEGLIGKIGEWLRGAERVTMTGPKLKFKCAL